MNQDQIKALYKAEQIKILEKIEALKTHFENLDLNDPNINGGTVGNLEHVNHQLDELNY